MWLLTDGPGALTVHEQSAAQAEAYELIVSRVYVSRDGHRIAPKARALEEGGRSSC